MSTKKQRAESPPLEERPEDQLDEPGKSPSPTDATNDDTKESSTAGPPFSVFTNRDKWGIMALASVAGMFSSLTANSYFPAIQVIADAFHTTVELINVTVTVYMVLQGLTPMIFGTLSDRVGRRPIFLTCLALLSVSCVGMALVPTNAYWLLVVLRCFQAAGSASTIALGACASSIGSNAAWSESHIISSNTGCLLALGLNPLRIRTGWTPLCVSPIKSKEHPDASHSVRGNFGRNITKAEPQAPTLTVSFMQSRGVRADADIGSGTISDIAEPAERGGLVGLFTLGPLIGPCLGPIIGGLLAGSLGWRSIFWFLCIASGMYFIILLLLYPETLRLIVGNGSIPPPRFNRPLVPIFAKYTPSSTAPRQPPRKFINPLRQFTHPTIVLVLVFNGTVYSVFYGVTATMSTLFVDAYPNLTESEIGLCFLAVGVGCVVGSFTNGRMLDAAYKRTERKLDKKAEAQAGEKGVRWKDRNRNRDGEIEADFPIEYARLQGVPIYLALFVASTVGYGWSIQKKVHISAPLILQVIVGWSIVSIMNTSQTLLIDLFPKQGSSITAANNLVRCSMGATLISIIDFILRALRPGWTFVLLCGICVIMWPMNWAVIRYGPRWRERRKAGDDARLAKEELE